MAERYKARPITPVDAVRWDGLNFAEVQEVCPEVQVSGMGPTILSIPVKGLPVDVYVGEMILKTVGGGEYSKLSIDVFMGLYQVQ